MKEILLVVMTAVLGIVVANVIGSVLGAPVPQTCQPQADGTMQWKN